MNGTILPQGITVALVSPTDLDGVLDLRAVEALIERCLRGGVAGLSPCGSTGEGTRLSRAQRDELVGCVVANAEARPVFSGIPSGPQTEVLDEIEARARAGVDAVLLTPPGYYSSTPESVIEYFSGIADRSALPLVLYHIPGLSGAAISASAVKELAQHRQIIGIKDSNRDMEMLRRFVRAGAGQDFTVLSGSDTLLCESLSAGAIGAIVPSPCVRPRLAVEAYSAWQRGEFDRARSLQDDILGLVEACRGEFPAGWKAAVAASGIGAGVPVPPGKPASEPTVAAVERAVRAESR